FVAFLLKASELTSERFDGRTGLLFRLRFPLRSRGREMGFRLRVELSNQVLLALPQFGLSRFVLLEHFLAKPSFQIAHSYIGFRYATAHGILALVLYLRADSVQFRFP